MLLHYIICQLEPRVVKFSPSTLQARSPKNLKSGRKHNQSDGEPSDSTQSAAPTANLNIYIFKPEAYVYEYNYYHLQGAQ